MGEKMKVKIDRKCLIEDFEKILEKCESVKLQTLNKNYCRAKELLGGACGLCRLCRKLYVDLAFDNIQCNICPVVIDGYLSCNVQNSPYRRIFRKLNDLEGGLSGSLTSKILRKKL